MESGRTAVIGDFIHGIVPEKHGGLCTSYFLLLILNTLMKSA